MKIKLFGDSDFFLYTVALLRLTISHFAREVNTRIVPKFRF